MIFQGYGKIEEDFKRYNLSEEEYRKLNLMDWVVTEKIHGANFSVITNGAFLYYAKRKELLEDEDDFFGYKNRLQVMELQFLFLYEQLQAEVKDLSQITIFGELFGGGYPHPDVVPNEHVNLVQSGIYYSPDIEFMVFDIMLFKGDAFEYMDYTKMVEYCDKYKIPCCKPLFIGKLSSALNFSHEFESTVSALLGFPKLDSSNKAEGIVIKPVEPFMVETPKGLVRPIIKRKIAEFSEDMYSQSAQEGDLRQQVLALINKNRMNNALSKIGSIKKGDKAKMAMLQQYIQQDIEEELDVLATKQYKKPSAKQKETLLEEARKAIDSLINSCL